MKQLTIRQMSNLDRVYIKGFDNSDNEADFEEFKKPGHCEACNKKTNVWFIDYDMSGVGLCSKCLKYQYSKSDITEVTQ